MWFQNSIELIFGLSLFLNACLFIPQAIQILRKQNAEGVSLLTFVGFNFIQLFTILHGYFNQDYLLMLGFTLSFITCAYVSYLAWVYRK